MSACLHLFGGIELLRTTEHSKKTKKFRDEAIDINKEIHGHAWMHVHVQPSKSALPLAASSAARSLS
jgi:hypothetical protein